MIILFLQRDVQDIVVILTYVDDLLLTGSISKLIQEIKDLIHSKFKMKDFGDTQYFLDWDPKIQKWDITKSKEVCSWSNLRHWS